jgi:hypothetical protein
MKRVIFVQIYNKNKFAESIIRSHSLQLIFAAYSLSMNGTSKGNHKGLPLHVGFVGANPCGCPSYRN